MSNSGRLVVTGIFEFWEDEELLLHGLHGTSFPGFRQEEEGRSGLALTLRWAFAAARGNSLYLSVVSLLPQDSLSALACSWFGDVTTVVTGDPPAPRILGPNAEYGDLGLKLMLEPSSLAEIIPGPWPRDFDVDGLRIAADPLAVPDFQCRGAERFRVAHEPESNVITSWVAEIHGLPARRQVVTNLAASEAPGESGAG